MSLEQCSAAFDAPLATDGEIRELSMAELTAVSGGFIVLIEAVAPTQESNDVLLSE